MSHDQAADTAVPRRDTAGASVRLVREPDPVAASLAPSHLVALLRRDGYPVIAELGLRDRNRVAVEGEIAAFADAGVTGIRVVTGEETVAGASPVFDLDAGGVAGLVRSAGLPLIDSAAPEPPVALGRTTSRRRRATACPKNMEFGPCGGVDPDGTCEIDDHACVFIGRESAVPWCGDAPAVAPAGSAGEVMRIMARRPLILTGFPVPPMDGPAIEITAEILRGCADAVLSGDAGSSRTQFPPAYRALRMTEAGVRVWMGVNARDRNRLALDRELRSLREIGVAGVHCVTGDHTLTGTRPDARPVFDLESTTLLPRAAALGLLTSFAESPAAPPAAIRGERVRQKERAGGRMCLTQYCGDAADVARFVGNVRAAGSTVPVLPGVPVVVDRFGAELLAGFHAAKLPTGYLDALFAARDIRAAGIRLAVEYARELLALDDVAGVVVAGGAAPGTEPDYARALASVSAELGGGS